LQLYFSQNTACSIVIVRDQAKGGNMKKYTFVLVAFAMTMLIGCSGEKAEDTEEGY